MSASPSDLAEPGRAPESAQAGVAVTLDYKLYDVAGHLVEASGPGETLEVLLGVQALPRALERAVTGLRVGGVARVRLPPEEAFGRRDEDAVITVDRDELPRDSRLGDELEAEREDGSVVFMRIIGLSDDMAELDLNHPLASQQIELELRVAALRRPSAEELREAEQALPAASDVANVPAWALVRSKRPPEG
jgi:FKBP-type peptidyl-prolyl cis-trans isomerase SlyD